MEWTFAAMHRRAGTPVMLVVGTLILGCRGGDGPTVTDNPCEAVQQEPLGLELGQTVELSDSAPECLVLRGSGAEYVLTAYNLRSEFDANAPIADPLAHLRAQPRLGALGATYDPAWDYAEARGGARHDPNTVVATSVPITERVRGPSVIAPSLAEVQARLAVAGVGERVWIPDRWNSGAACQEAEPPLFEAVVLAVSGSAALLADARLPTLDQQTRAELQPKLERAAAQLDRVYLETMRVVVSPSFAPPGGAGGRIFTLFTDITAQIGTTILWPEGYPRSVCPHSLEVSVALLPANLDAMSVGQIVGSSIHEHTHNADIWLGVQLNGAERGTADWATEALATTAQEQAARIAAQERVNFHQSQHDPDSPLTWWPEGRWPGTPRPEFQPLWGPRALPQHAPPAAYGTGGLLLLFLREQLGQIWPGEETGPTPFERLAPARDWSIPALATLVNTTPEELYGRFVMAVALDDRLPADIIAAYGIPQFATWDNGWRVSAAESTWRPYESPLSLGTRDESIAVGAGTYGIWRITPPGETLRIRNAPVTSRPSAKLRITRVR